MSLDFLPERALDRLLLVKQGEKLPREVVEPWIVRTALMTEESPAITAHQIRFFIVVPRKRVQGRWGGKLSVSEAVRCAEGVWSISGKRRAHLRGMARLIMSPSPIGYTTGYDSPTIRYCAAHCSNCGLHFTSESAFDQHCREGHKHPSKSDKLLVVKGRDTGCAAMGLAYDNPLAKHLPYQDQTTRYVPGVRMWEHVNAARVREYWADKED